MIGGVASAQAAQTTSAHSIRAAGEGVVALLPAPDLTGLANTQDALTVLYALRIEQGHAETQSVEVAVTRQKEQSAVQLRRELAAMEAARQAEREASGFWGKLKSVAGTIAKVAAVVAGAAAIVASGGTAAALVVGIAAVALSAGGTVVRETKMLGKDSDKIALGMEVAGAAMGMGGAAAAALGAAPAATSTASSAVATVGTTAQATSAAATGVGAAAGIRVAHLHADADHARAQAEDARFRMAANQRETDFLLRTLAEAKEAEQAALDTTIKAIEGCNQAADVAIAGVKG